MPGSAIRIVSSVAVIAIFVAACSGGGGATRAPATVARTVAPVGTQAGATQAANQYTLAGYCTAFNASVVPAWPPKDAAAAFAMAQYFRDWATVTELASIQDDMTTVFNWITVASLSTSALTPPTADVTAAYGRIKDFVASHC